MYHKHRITHQTERTRKNREIHFAQEKDLNPVNELRKQVNDLHVAGKPDVFKPGFNETAETEYNTNNIPQPQSTSSGCITCAKWVRNGTDK